MPKLSFLAQVPIVAVLAASGCAVARHEVYTPAVVAGQRGVIFAVDGAGDFQATSAALRQAVADERLPLGVEAVEWSHGYGRVLADEMDWDHAWEEGQCLARRVCALRQACPAGEIYLIGHSAGSAVVLTAAEALPPGTINRIVLLAPSVSAEYDVRAALRATRDGIDVFYSCRDRAYLGVGVAIVGTADRRWSAAAGRVGFHGDVQTPQDALLYAKLRQHAWDPCVEWTGNHGGHYGGYQVSHLRAYVLPLLRCGDCPPGPCAVPAAAAYPCQADSAKTAQFTFAQRPVSLDRDLSAGPAPAQSPAR
ncbi:MAG TPA: alpha/beta hydrolase [Gemmataceae bacterium]|nr:alpha/beta hydrolase [Gemmataceae bacterium]